LQWVGLPGLGCPPNDFALVEQAGHVSIRTLDQTRVSLVASTQDLAGELNLDQLDRIGLVGHSLGAVSAINLALDLARQRPGVLGGLVLLDPSIPWERTPPAIVTARELDTLVRRIMAGHLAGELAAMAMTQVVRGSIAFDFLRAGGRISRAQWHQVNQRGRWYEAALDEPLGAVHLWEDFRESWAYEAQAVKRLESLSVPLADQLGVDIIQVTGMRSRCTKKQASRAFAQLLRARLMPAWRSAHLIPLTQPALVARAMSCVGD
jgi:pimeloyl-ACP methyl ester carboxylesterase